MVVMGDSGDGYSEEMGDLADSGDSAELGYRSSVRDSVMPLAYLGDSAQGDSGDESEKY